jgi:DNA-binding transcriptional ArsR family regulator
MNRVYRALADPTRRRVLAMLRAGDLTAGQLASQFDLSWPTMSGHFTILKEADLISSEREGSTIRYHLNVTVLEEAMLALMDAFRIGPSSPEPDAPGPPAPGPSAPGPSEPGGSAPAHDRDDAA